MRRSKLSLYERVIATGSPASIGFSKQTLKSTPLLFRIP